MTGTRAKKQTMLRLSPETDARLRRLSGRYGGLAKTVELALAEFEARGNAITAETALAVLAAEHGLVVSKPVRKR